jgi:hypothetical protein
VPMDELREGVVGVIVQEGVQEGRVVRNGGERSGGHAR